MKNIQRGTMSVVLAFFITIYSCGPTDDKGAMDQENSKGEGAIDSTRLPNFDSATTGTGVDSATMR